MAHGTVTRHSGGYVAFNIPYDATVHSYHIYSSLIGPDVTGQMVFVLNVNNVNSGGGLSNFLLLDTQLKITRAVRPWNIRILPMDAFGNPMATLESIPGTLIPAVTDDDNSILQQTVGANFDGSIGNGLIDFQQSSELKLSRIVFHLVNSPFALYILDAAGNLVDFLSDATSNTTDVAITESDCPVLALGEKLKFVTTTPGNHMIKVTKESPE